ncbi:TonB-dependent receptor [Janthinobacterium sp. GW460P]|uniref:TonB-dependent receptor n=1 Tax=unclassified Janthinobacterium TaxID=2610881 RepID=UPI000A3285A8|nr:MULTISPECIES: TonB-dependent receptor [unclassified Janthinobacterium]MCC7701917.1 TonB-dependent receptor [Janthinobacterium sp. GW460P]MCC7707425.1 TonB-dependent receptor [Janthinobacterium sp. GW460W]
MTPRSLPLFLAALFSANAAHADDIFQRVLVDGSRLNQLGVADSANAGSVTQQQLDARTSYRPGELLEAVPGLIVSQHSGEGKANQFYLRGFNLDHGTDLRTTVDEMPVNQRSHGHGQGWTDLNFLIPELAMRLDYKKGPYAAAQGDFSSAGAASVVYANRLTQGIASAGIGQNGFRRALLADSIDAGGGSLLYALEAQHNDGPFTQPDRYRKRNGVLRYSEGYANNGFNVTAMAYDASWNATDQIPLRAVQDGSLDRFGAVDASDGGKAQRYSLSGAWRQTTDDISSRVSAYVIANRLALFSNFTYAMDDPLNGDQFAQPDRRVTAGLDASHTWHRHTDRGSSDTTIGLQLQNDNIHNGLYRTRRRQILSTTRQDHIVESSLGVYAENSTRWTRSLRTVAGLRADAYRFDVRSDRAANAGTASDHVFSPSLSVIAGPWRETEAYLNIGNGFHSNDARGTTITIDPRTGEAAGKVTPLARSRGLELGVRSAAIAGLQTSLSLYRLDFDSELLFIGDAGATEAGRPSRRYGIEFSSYYKAAGWLSLDLDLAYARARSRGSDPAGDFIPGAIEGVAQLAITVTPPGPWSGALRLRYFGPRPLVEDNSVRSAASVGLNGRIAYRIDKTLRVELEGYNLANRRDSATDYYYASRLPGEAQPVDDIHFHPVESRSLRLTLVKNF